MEHGHTPAEIQERLGNHKSQNYLGDFVYGGIDGTITTFALVAGIEGAGLSRNIILVLGAANILADGFSMAASNYSGTKTDLENVERLSEIENRHIDEVPDGERAEVREILKRQGVEQPQLERSVNAITADRESWVKFMLAEEYGVAINSKSPLNAGVMTFVAFLVCGSVPLLPFLVGHESAFVFSCLATGLTFFCIGALKSKWSLSTWWRSGAETLAIGSLAAVIAYSIGNLFGHL